MNVGESDRLVTLFTREYGIIRAFATGAKNIKSKKGAATSLLTYGSFTVQRKKDSYRIYEATPIKMFFNLGSSLETLFISQYFCELAFCFGEENSPNEELFRLILNSLHFLINEIKFPKLIKAITEFRVASICGYAPNLIACDECGCFEADVMFFDLQNASLCCGNCNIKSGGVAINKTVLTAMRHIVYSDFNKLYSFVIPQNDAEALSKITESYIKIQTEHSFRTLELYNNIKE